MAATNLAVIVRLKGQPPVGGTRYELERLRYGPCGKLETADWLPWRYRERLAAEQSLSADI